MIMTIFREKTNDCTVYSSVMSCFPDDCDACHWALEQGRSHDGSPVKLEQADKAVCQHTWPPPKGEIL